MRQAFNFYRSYYDVFNELSEKDKLKFITALLDRQFTGVESELSGMAKFAYLSQKHSIDKQVIGYERAKNVELSKSELPLGSPPPLPIGSPPKEEKEKEEEKEEEKEQNNIQARKLAFKNKLWEDFKSSYKVETLKAFYEYWTEHGDNDKKMRYEKEKSFGVSRRLSTWARNDFNKTENPIEEKGRGGGGVSMEELYKL